MNNSFEPGDDPEWREYVKHVRENVVPQVEGSSLFISLCPHPDKVDVKFAVELGLSIMYNKPILAVIAPGTPIPEKLARVVDRFVELDLNDPTQKDRLTAVIEEMMVEFPGSEET